MTIRDRGKIKWMAASFMPEVFAMTRDMYKDAERQARPILDVYQTEEFDQRICYAMESNYAVKITVWSDGFTADYTGRIHYVDPITHRLRIEVKPGEYERIAFDDVVGVVVVEKQLVIPF
nr:YolD-like family protein [Neobacillus sp. Marseille-Q6967]